MTEKLFLVSIFFVFGVINYCCVLTSEKRPSQSKVSNEIEVFEEIKKDQEKHIIDLSHWKVTLPVGKPTEVKPPEILDYRNNSLLKDYMYDDISDSSLVFYTHPGATTTNTKYSRTELREQMVPGSNDTNWTFREGARIRGTLKMADISRDSTGKFHKAMVMQIYGRHYQ